MDTKNEFYSFRVAACHDAHVAMATEMGMPLYEVFIGGHENTRSCIRLYEHRRDLACTTEDHEHLHCHRLRSFWISWVDGLIKVGPGDTKHLYSICTMLDQRRRRWVEVVQMLYKYFVFAGGLLIYLALLSN